MLLKIKINVESKGEAYNIVSGLGFEHDVIEADLDGAKEQFGSNRKPSHFMKDMSKVKLAFKDRKDFKNK